MRRKQNILMIVIILVLSLGIGYAFLTTDLTISGTADVDNNTWNVYLDNVMIEDDIIPSNQIIQAPTVNQNKLSMSFHIKLKEPGERLGFTFDAVNAGSLDAKIENIEVLANGLDASTSLPNYLLYRLEYNDAASNEILNDQILFAGQSIKYYFEILYNNWWEIDPEDLPSTNESVSITINITYSQAAKSNYYYSINSININDQKKSKDLLYNNYQSAIRDFNAPVFARLKYDNNDVLSEAEIGFIINNNNYYIKGGGATYNQSQGYYNNDSIYYESNVYILNQVFGQSNCHHDDMGYSCELNDIYTSVNDQGNISVSYNPNSGFSVAYVCRIHNENVVCVLESPS